MSSKIFIGDHSTVIIAFAHVTHIELDQTNHEPVLNVYILGIAEPIKLRGEWARVFPLEYIAWAEAS